VRDNAGMSVPCYSSRFDEALGLAAAAFRDRRRKGTEIPYVAHLLQVAVWVAEGGGDEEQLIAAVLHDYLEDIEGSSAAELRTRFGERVTRLVEALSDTTVRPKPPWRERKERYLAHLRAAPAEVKLISACDKLHNARSILRDLGLVGDEVWARFSATKGDTLWYYREVAGALAHEFDHPVVREVDEAVRALVRAAKV